MENQKVFQFPGAGSFGRKCNSQEYVVRLQELHEELLAAGEVFRVDVKDVLVDLSYLTIANDIISQLPGTSQQ